MAEAFNLLKRVRSLEVSPELSGYSGVRIYAGQDDEGNSIEYFAGNEIGKVLEITNDWGTQAQADAISRKILGYRYQPYTATGSQVDPSVELGDAVTVADTYGGVFSRRSIYGKHVISDVSAPFYDEIEHEFQIQSPTNRQYDRFTRQMRASLSITHAGIQAEAEERKSDVEQLTSKLKIQADLIEAKVSKTGGNASSFGWELNDSSWTIKANSREILKATINGLEVYGKITATSGRIGGFDITSDSLVYNNQKWNGTNSTGIYIGPSGIQLGKNFKVSSSGHLEAASGEFSGTVHAGSIQYGGNYGTLSGSGISSASMPGNRLVGNTVSTAYLSGGVNTSLGHADSAYAVTSGSETAATLYAGTLRVSNQLYLDGQQLYLRSTTIAGTSIRYVAW